MAANSPLPFQAEDPKIATSNTGDPSSFAYSTARTRWTKILDQIIEAIGSHVVNTSSISDEEANEGGRIQAQIMRLKAEMERDEPLQTLIDDGASDIEAYNQELQALQPITWRNAPWLYTECYMYRRLYTLFTTSTTLWQTFDVFAEDKKKALKESKKGAIELIKHFNSLDYTAVDEAVQKALFEEMLQISLWGNATDLALLTSLSSEELEVRQGKAAREKSKANIVADDTEEVWSLLSGLKASNHTTSIHYVLDNSGFELLADLVFISYLLDSGFTKRVIMHGKRMPWFVSDVNLKDLDELIDGFANGETYNDLSPSDSQELSKAANKWLSLMDQGKLSFSAHAFWTTQHPYGRMAVVEPALYEQLASADLVIYKGDLNYRKLTYDGMWPKTTSFEEAIGPLAKKQLGNKGVRTLVLRTAKADVGVGLPAGMEETLPADWTRTGKYAMVHYWDAKS